MLKTLHKSRLLLASILCITTLFIIAVTILFKQNPSYININYTSAGDLNADLSIGFERYKWLTDSPCCRWLYDSDNKKVFQLSKQGEPKYLSSWLEHNAVKGGKASLAVWLKTPPPPTTANWKEDPNYVKQRLEFEISNGKYNTHHLEQARFYSLSMYIDPRSAPSQKKGVVFMQADQSHDTTHAKYPAFFVRFKDNSAYQWEINIASDKKTDTRTTHGTPEVIYASPDRLKRGVWHDFTVYFKPSAEGNGAITVWYNNKRVVKLTDRNLGYAPEPKPFVINDYFWVRFGAYRRPEPNKPGDILLMFDDARSGLTLDSVR